VGGWEESGIDPSLFSQALMYYSAQSARRRISQDSLGDDISTDEVDIEAPLADPALILNDAYEGVMAEPDVIAGVSP
jgi:protein phosphatase PTC7